MASEIDDEISNHDVITDDSEMDIDKPIPGWTNSMPLWLKGKIPEDWVWFFSMWVDVLLHMARTCRMITIECRINF